MKTVHAVNTVLYEKSKFKENLKVRKIHYFTIIIFKSFHDKIVSHLDNYFVQICFLV